MIPPGMSEVTLHLDALRKGDQAAREALLNCVYRELHRLAANKMAHEPAGHTLQPTALVHEAWLRLGDGARFENRAHFFSAAAEAMRRILIDGARRRGAMKHGGGLERCNIDDVELAAPGIDDSHLLAVNAALDRFAKEEPQKAELVKLRFFAGLTLPQAAEVLGLSHRTANRYWAYAKAWLFVAMNEQNQ